MRKEVYDEMNSLKELLVDNHDPCGGHGYLPEKVPGQLNPCKCMTVAEYLYSLIEAKIPRGYWWLSLDDLEIDEEYIELCKWFLDRLDNAVQHSLGLLFLGANGIGKTSMQCAIGKEAVVQGYSVQYFTAQQYLEAVKNKSKDDTILKEYESGKVILFDEMDKAYFKSGSNFVTKTLEDFMRRKTSDGSVFVICTNHDQETLTEVFGQSTVSMLRRHLRFVDVEGEDYSKQLQDRWNSLMKSDTDYYAKQIMSMAQRMLARKLREDDLEWEETDR